MHEFHTQQEAGVDIFFKPSNAEPGSMLFVAE